MLLILFSTKDLQRIVFLASMITVVGDPEIGCAQVLFTRSHDCGTILRSCPFFVVVGLHTPEQTQREIVQAILSFGGCVSDALLQANQDLPSFPRASQVLGRQRIYQIPSTRNKRLLLRCAHHPER